jgi:hypothetical protein
VAELPGQDNACQQVKMAPAAGSWELSDVALGKQTLLALDPSWSWPPSLPPQSLLLCTLASV